ncbi:MAG: hypothetical protein WC975_00985 [Phycisphaerae bacterium]
MAVIGTLTNSRKFRWIAYIVLSAFFAVYCFYDGWFNPKYINEPSDLWFNRVAAIALTVLCVILIIGFFVIKKTRVAVDQTGFDIDGKIQIPWSAITGIDARSLEKGFLVIFYKAGDREKKYTLDSYKTTCFEEMVDELSNHRPDLLEPAEQRRENGQNDPKEDKRT